MDSVGGAQFWNRCFRVLVMCGRISPVVLFDVHQVAKYRITNDRTRTYTTLGHNGFKNFRLCYKEILCHFYCAGLRRHNSTHAPTSPSLLNTHEISYPHPTPTPLHHTQDACQSINAYKFCCQSVNLKMAIRAETCS